MIKSIRSLISICFVLSIANCGGGDPPDWDAFRAAASVKTESGTIPATENLVVYLDTSASMAGYVSPNGKTAFSVSPDGNTVFSKTLLELRNVVTTMNPQPQVVVRKVATDISSPSFSDLDLSQASISRNIFNGRDTNLAGAIKAFSEPVDAAAQEGLPPRFHVLITDGVQSSKQNNNDISCSRGSDSICVKKQILELMNSGWGGAILGLTSEFNGNVYSEISNRAVPYASGKEAGKFRPFYLYIFSPDRTALDGLVSSLRQKLSGIVKADSLREYSLTTSYGNGRAAVEIQQDQASKELLEIQEKTEKDIGTPRLDVLVNLDTESIGRQKFSVNIKPAWTANALGSGSSEELAGLIKWEVKPVYPETEDSSRRYPDFKMTGQKIANGQPELTFEVGWPKGSGQPNWRMYDVIGKLDVARTGPNWVSRWSTDLDNTADRADRTLNFESSVANLWDNSALRDNTIAEIRFRIGQN